MARQKERDVRQVYPTAGELQRMPWHARMTLERRIRQLRRQHAATEPEEDTTTGPEDLSDTQVRRGHREYQNGVRTDSAKLREREYQRRRKAANRATGAQRGSRITWDLDLAIRMRRRGARWCDISRTVGASEDAVSKAVARALAREEKGQAA